MELEINTFRLPPVGFEPLVATDIALARFGLPPRPRDRRHRSRYDHVLRTLAGGKLRMIEPELDYRSDCPRRSLSVAVGGSEIHSDRSGRIAYAAARDPSIWVHGSCGVADAGGPSVDIQPSLPWCPDGRWTVTNLTVDPGAVVTAMVVPGGGRSREATVCLANLSSGQATSFALIAPELLGRQGVEDEQARSVLS